MVGKEDKDLPHTVEELKELVEKTKKKLGIENKENKTEELTAIQRLDMVVRRINQIGPQKITDHINSYLKSNKKGKIN